MFLNDLNFPHIFRFRDLWTTFISQAYLYRCHLDKAEAHGHISERITRYMTIFYRQRGRRRLIQTFDYGRLGSKSVKTSYY